MFEIARYESERRLPAAAAIAVGLSLFAALFLALAPSVLSTVDLDAYAEALPPAMRAAFGVEALGTLEGFLATELYQFGWVLLLGLYFAYAAGGTVAGDVERGRMDLLLSTPVSRARVVGEKFLSLLVPVVLINAVVAAVVYVGASAVADPLALSDVIAVHALSVPYLLCCVGVGLLLSVAVDRESLAQRGALGAVFGLFMLDTVTVNTDYAWLGALSPTRYYDPTAILVDGTHDLTGAAVLLVAAAALAAASALWFRRRDV